jgi:membrane-associated phospholipid phosphatase
MILLYLIPYLLVNHLPLVRHTIPFCCGEDRIPFLPWTFMIYCSAFVQAAIIIRLMPSRFLPKMILFAAGMMLTGIIIFLLVPIEYPRNLYPNTNALIALFRATDGAGNCFPSLHVAMTLFLAAGYGAIEKSSIKTILMWFWAGGIILSVLTTKQHYLIDIVGGAILAIPCMIFSRPILLGGRAQSIRSLGAWEDMDMKAAVKRAKQT